MVLLQHVFYVNGKICHKIENDVEFQIPLIFFLLLEIENYLKSFSYFWQLTFAYSEE